MPLSIHGRRKHYKRGETQVLRGTLKKFLKSVRDCFEEPRVAVNELETHLGNCFFSFHAATGYLKVNFSYAVGKKGNTVSFASPPPRVPTSMYPFLKKTAVLENVFCFVFNFCKLK